MRSSPAFKLAELFPFDRWCETKGYEPTALRSSLACCSAFLAAPLASAPAFSAWMALFKDSAFSPSATLHPETSALVCTPVMLALRQVKFSPRLWLACKAARHSFRAVNAEHAWVALEL